MRQTGKDIKDLNKFCLSASFSCIFISFPSSVFAFFYSLCCQIIAPDREIWLDVSTSFPSFLHTSHPSETKVGKYKSRQCLSLIFSVSLFFRFTFLFRRHHERREINTRVILFKTSWLIDFTTEGEACLCLWLHKLYIWRGRHYSFYHPDGKEK